LLGVFLLWRLSHLHCHVYFSDPFLGVASTHYVVIK
jgi:hypothetical protein